MLTVLKYGCASYPDFDPLATVLNEFNACAVSILGT